MIEQGNKQFVNIIFFIRYIDPREPDLDLLETFRQQVELVRNYGFPATFLMEYDSLISSGYQEVFACIPQNCEIGGWFEVVQPLVEKAGLTWRGREGYPWDWHSHVGFSVGYTQEERRKLVDVYMEDYRAILGEYPKSMGSWMIDAYTLDYMQQKYKVSASCICRDQWGTDGYTLWGGYYGQGYYPSKKNVFCPAQTPEQQIPVPVFRMLGSDPIYQYDFGLQQGNDLLPSEDQGVVTLEPVYNAHGGGASPKWVKWYFQENFCPNTLTFNYTQVGQENSFGWEAMRDGLHLQFGELEKMTAQKKVTPVTLSELGAWYRDRFPLTASTSMTALSDWRDHGHQTAWYNGRFYRANLYRKQNRFWIRDIHLFREDYGERYLNAVCPGKSMWYDNLPLVDGNRWSGGGTRSGWYFLLRNAAGEERELQVKDFSVAYPDEHTMQATVQETDGILTVECREKELNIRYQGSERLIMRLSAGITALPFQKVEAAEWKLQHENFSYAIRLRGCQMSRIHRDGNFEIITETEDNQAVLQLD